MLRPALAELNEAVDYYNLQQPGLGRRFLTDAREAVSRIERFPLAWHSLGGAIRRCQLRHFPYGVIYEPTEQEIVVIAVAHLHREPEYWRGRITKR